MHHVVALIAERHEGTCTSWSLSRLFQRWLILDRKIHRSLWLKWRRFIKV
ncbi:hypothetical protein Hanom_Chr06g00556511 [Helianthus anomalus]